MTFEDWVKLGSAAEPEFRDKAIAIQEAIEEGMNEGREDEDQIHSHLEILGRKKNGVFNVEGIRITAINPTVKNGGTILSVSWTKGRLMNPKKRPETFAQGFVGHARHLL
jgi:hypothetical protein